MLVLFFFILLALVMRLPFLVMSKPGATDDGMGVLSKLHFLSKSNFNTYKIADALNHEGFFPRPNLFHYLVSRLPRKLWRIALVLGNVIPDIVVGLVLILCLEFWSLIDLFSIESSLTFLAFSTAPIFFPHTARLKATNGRTMGFMFSSVYFIILLELLLQNSTLPLPWIITTAVACLFLVFWSSTFASQATVFLSLLFAALNFEVLLLLPLLIFFTLGLLFKPLGIRSLILFKIAHTKYYAKVQLSSFSTKSRTLFNFLRLLDPNFNRAQRLELVLKHSPVLIALYSIPIIFFIDYTFGRSILIIEPSLLKLTGIFALSILLLFILTSVSWGKLFGESERYLEYVQFPFLIILTQTIDSELLIEQLFLLIVMQLTVIVIVTLLNTHGSIQKLTSFSKSYPEEIIEIVEYLNSRKGDKNVLCVPLRFSRAFSSYSTNQSYDSIRYYYRLVVSGISLNDYLKTSIEEMLNQNVPAFAPNYFKEKYGVNYIVIDKSQHIESDFFDKLKSQTEKLLSTGNYELYFLKDAAHATHGAQ